jgi:hypothetical protein
MRYIQPQVTGTFDAVATIRGTKVIPFSEPEVELPTNNAAYEADE